MESHAALDDNVIDLEPLKATTGRKGVTKPDPEVLDPVEGRTDLVVMTEFSHLELALRWVLENVATQSYDMAIKTDVARARQNKDALIKLRQRAEELYTEWNRPRMQEAARVREMRDFFEYAIKQIETPLAAQINADNERKKAEKARLDQIEADRIHAHRVAIADLTALPDQCLRASPADIQTKLDELLADGYLDQRNWQEFLAQAGDVVTTVANTLMVHLESAQNREKLEQIQRQAEIDRQAREDEATRQQEEATRVQGLRDRLAAIEMTPRNCLGMTAAFIQTQIDSLTQVDPSTFAELAEAALAAKTATLRDLADMVSDAKQKEADDAELKQLRADRAAREQKAKDDAAAADALAQQAEEQARQRRADAMSQIQGIQQQVIIATLGRAGVRKGGTLECIRDTLAETAAWVIDAEQFGEMTGAAKEAKEEAVAAITQLLAEATQREADRMQRETEAAERLDRETAQRKLDDAVNAEAKTLLGHLRIVTAQAREAGHDWLCLAEAEGLINRIDPEGKV